jgi:hypothetical protein
MTSRHEPLALPIRRPVEQAASILADVRVAAAVSAGIAFVVYLRTMLPGVSVGDWAEMQFVPAQLSVPHPTGYPLYVLLGKLFSLLPVASGSGRLSPRRPGWPWHSAGPCGSRRRSRR